MQNRILEILRDGSPAAVLALTGGGGAAVAALLQTPGISAVLRAVHVPYSAEALTRFLGRQPDQFCSADAALAMATTAFGEAKALSEKPLSRSPETESLAEVLTFPTRNPESPPRRPLEKTVVIPAVGIGCTAALRSVEPKRGSHRAFVAVQTDSRTVLCGFTMEKATRSRSEEDELVGQLILRTWAMAVCPEFDTLDDLPVKLASEQATELLNIRVVVPPAEIRRLCSGENRLVWSTPNGVAEGVPPEQLASLRGLVCGSFNPLHAAHMQLREIAERLLGGDVAYELSVGNVDKPALDFLSLEDRRRQFLQHPVAITAVSRFYEKADLFRNVTFVIGVDTAQRLVDSRYYRGGMDVETALRRIRDRGGSFLVAGRSVSGRFCSLNELNVPAGFADMFREIPESEFRLDLSSTELRRGRAQADNVTRGVPPV